METKIINLPEISIIGKEGLCTKGHNIVKELWNEANSHFSEVAGLGMKNLDGTYVGFWGAMSDESMSFRPWTEDFSRGLYLAGVEVDKDAIAPPGWTKWTMPTRTYLVVAVALETYAETFAKVIGETLSEMGLSLAGAVCDFTEPATGKNNLFFPVMQI